MSYDLLSFHMMVYRQTPKAILAALSETPEDAVWLPKSQIEWQPPLLMNWRQVISIPQWLAEKHDIPLTARLAGEQQHREYKPPSQNRDRPNLPDAHEIFGLDKDFSEKELITSYRKLMAKVHPDVGGTDGLAKMLNILKDQLMGKR